jgi:hypothetical protein
VDSSGPELSSRNGLRRTDSGRRQTPRGCEPATSKPLERPRRLNDGLSGQIRHKSVDRLQLSQLDRGLTHPVGIPNQFEARQRSKGPLDGSRLSMTSVSARGTQGCRQTPKTGPAKGTRPRSDFRPRGRSQLAWARRRSGMGGAVRALLIPSRHRERAGCPGRAVTGPSLV